MRTYNTNTQVELISKYVMMICLNSLKITMIINNPIQIKKVAF